MKDTVNQIAASRDITLEQLTRLLTTDDRETIQHLFDTAHATAKRY